jgi:GT2 family glycosyltransferase
MAEGGAVWVGMLDIDETGPVVGVSSPEPIGYQHARVLIRMHRAPLGQVLIAAMPADTFAARVRHAAESELAGALRQHFDWDNSTREPTGSPDWVAQAACPRHFPSRNGAGVTIIVCTRDRTEGLRDCLHTLQQVTYEPLEIIVVDNAPSGDATYEAVATLAEDDPRISYTCEPLPGLSRARNHGMALAKFEVVAFTDDDTLVDPGWPAVVAAGFAADPEAVCVTGLVASSALDTSSQRYFDARIPWGEGFEPRRYDLNAHRHPSRMYPFKAGMFGTGANFAVRHSAVTRLGGFDPLLGVGAPSRGGEDLDIFLRLILAGGRICYMPSAVIWHRHRADAEALSEQLYSYGHGLGAYVAKHLPNRDLRHALIGHGVGQASMLLTRMGRASKSTELPGGGKRLAWAEARGVVAGALCYRQTARRTRSASGAP